MAWAHTANEEDTIAICSTDLDTTREEEQGKTSGDVEADGGGRDEGAGENLEGTSVAGPGQASMESTG